MSMPVRHLRDEFDILHPTQQTTVRNAVEQSAASGCEAVVTCLTGGTATARPGKHGIDWSFGKEANIACGTWREAP